jgi:hypothetical protein
MRLAGAVLWRGLLTLVVAMFLTGTGAAQSFKRKAPATTAKATAKKKTVKKAPRKRTRVVKKKPPAKREEPRRPMP